MVFWCKGVFRSTRSITSVFSTVFNFGMLGLLRRIHRLQIQSRIQAESEAVQIIFLQVLKHKAKEGNNSVSNNLMSQSLISEVTDSDVNLDQN